MKENTRQQQIVHTGYIGIATNVLVVIGKAAVGLASGSIAIILDAVNNLADALSSLVTIIGVKLAGRPADDKHPFGYGRIEYFAAIIVAALILIAGGTSLKESIQGILEPSSMDFSLVSLIIIATTIIIKMLLGIYTKRRGKALSSDALISSGTECLFDCVVSVATLISALIFYMSGLNIDSWLAAIISCLIIKAGIEMLMSPINELLGSRSSVELTSAIKQRVKETTGVRGVYDVVIHNYGPEQNFGALHVEVDDTTNAADLHQLTRQIQILLIHEFGIFFTVGFYAHHHEGTPAAAEEAKVRKYVAAQSGVLGMHGFYINHTDKIVSFDIVYSFKVHTPITLRQQAKDWLAKEYPGYTYYIGLDRNYSE